ncbi:MAG: iron hydrogenase small subunit, partial [archaeon]|nr:iron hydrogenase small subunit [archaeon]
PSVRVSIGEEFGMEPGTIVTETLVGALRQAGFERVFDTSLAADVVTIEEGTELLNRLEEKQDLPLFTSCCPASVLFVENTFPHYLNNFCTVKSPQQSMGSLIKTYYARKTKKDRRKVFVVSIMPCIVKKMEAKRPEMDFDGVPNVDVVLTTRETAALLKQCKIDLGSAKEEKFDSLLGSASGAGQLFGQTGGVSEALLRFVSWKIEGKKKRIEFGEVRGSAGLRSCEVRVGKYNLRLAIVDGLNNLRDLLGNEKKFRSYDVVEIMTCPGGCIGGGGQPQSSPEKIAARKKALQKIDASEEVRVASENPQVKELYTNYLIEPGSKSARSILHVSRICLKCD